jgi:diacylglycerol O-acyltransferase
VQTGHVGGLALFKLPRGAKAGFFQRVVESHSDWRQVTGIFKLKLGRKGVGLGWVETEQMDIESHLQYLMLPKPGTRRQLFRVVERLHEQHLDRQHPLWEMTFIEGLEGGHGAIYIKVHHALVDGISAIRLFLNSLSTTAEASATQLLWHMRTPLRPTSASKGAGRIQRIAGRVIGLIEGIAAAVPAASTEALRSALYALGLRRGPTASTFMAPRTIFNRQITARRRFAAHEFSFRDLKAVTQAAEATVNDVVLMVCASALRRYLLELEALPKEPLTTWMPVSLRRADDDQPGNQITLVSVSLATDTADPQARFRAIQAGAAAVKQEVSSRSREANEWLGLLRGGIPIATDLLGVNEIVVPTANVTISNVPGITQDFYFHGAKLEVIYPLSVLLGSVGLNITLLSCGDVLGVGLLACPDTVPELEKLASYLGDAFEEFRQMVATPPQAATVAKRKDKRQGA